MVVCSGTERPAEGADVPLTVWFCVPLAMPFELTAVLGTLENAGRLALTSPPMWDYRKHLHSISIDLPLRIHDFIIKTSRREPTLREELAGTEDPRELPLLT